MLNINVKVFSFGIGGDPMKCEWKEVFPDPAMADTAQFPKGLVPDMYLYHSDQTHYDLLVSEDHHLALLGMIVTQKDIKEPEIVKESNISDSEGWSFVKSKMKPQSSSEQLLDNADIDDYDDLDLEELDEEVIMARNKASGYKRIDPSSASESVSNEKVMFGCTWKNCKMQLESQGLLSAHMNQHKLIYACDECDLEVMTPAELNVHKKSQHGSKEWNCNNCSFQASGSSELRNHLKLTGHQPTPDIQDSKSKISHCYTCKEEYSSYWNLMNHRKQRHPSNRTCKYFLSNQCVHGVNCWYRHDEPMETDPKVDKPAPSSPKYKCNACDKTFDNLLELRTHRKSVHSVCNRFLEGTCPRSNNDCWYEHKTKETYSETSPKKEFNESVFQFPPLNPVPPENMQTIMKTLNMVLRKMEMMEEMFQEKKH